SIPFVEQALEALPDLQVIHIDDLDLYDPTIIAIADVQDFLTYKWRLPTIVIAFEHEGSALAQAWEAGALAGWVWNQLPKDLNKALTRIDAQYKRNQDSRDLPSAAELQKRLLPNPI
ncbi:RsbU family protein phosphatase GigA, partial [Acinetobacter baumannii]